MAQVFYIIGFHEHYVRSQARRLDTLKWITQSTNLNHDHYIEIVTQPNGEAIYGVFRAMLSLAATCEPQGVLVQRSGKPFDAASISAKTRMRQSIVVRALAVLTTDPRLMGTALSVAEAVRANSESDSERNSETNSDPDSDARSEDDSHTAGAEQQQELTGADRSRSRAGKSGAGAAADSVASGRAAAALLPAAGNGRIGKLLERGLSPKDARDRACECSDDQLDRACEIFRRRTAKKQPDDSVAYFCGILDKVTAGEIK